MPRSWILTGPPENHGGAAASERHGRRGGRAGMSAGRSASGAQPPGLGPHPGAGVWRELPQERRLAALAASALFFTLFLPWYQETVIANGVTSLRSASSSLTGWGAFSFVEAAVLLVAAGVLILLFMRAEGRRSTSPAATAASSPPPASGPAC